MLGDTNIGRCTEAQAVARLAKPVTWKGSEVLLQAGGPYSLRWILPNGTGVTSDLHVDAILGALASGCRAAEEDIDWEHAYDLGFAAGLLRVAAIRDSYGTFEFGSMPTSKQIAAMRVILAKAREFQADWHNVNDSFSLFVNDERGWRDFEVWAKNGGRTRRRAGGPQMLGTGRSRGFGRLATLLRRCG